ncbi:DUF742 domain-containing protein [Kitasatospora sp. NPDC057904]|uniref:DUF742 domain-containing protein n=1 Tax=unclassified Kitasatospora TaxID=2633591 RepID=UPI0036D88C7C
MPPWELPRPRSDAAAGPIVRPYAMTGGRTTPSRSGLDLVALVVSDVPDPAAVNVGPEHDLLLTLCRQRPLSVAELAADTDLPLGVVRVLLGDLLDSALIRVTQPAPPAFLADPHVLQEVIDGLRAL